MCKSDQRREKFLLWLSDFHLYDTPIEGLLKGIVWICSWIAGIHSTNKFGTIGAETASAFFIFGCAFLMDYVKSIKSKKNVFNRIIYATLIFALSFVVVVSFAEFVYGSIAYVLYRVMFWCSGAPLLVLISDVFLWLVVFEKPANVEQVKIETVNKKIELFNNKMMNGNLGDVEERGEH